MNFNYKLFGAILSCILVLVLIFIFVLNSNDETIKVCEPFDDDLKCVQKIYTFAQEQDNPDICDNIEEQEKATLCKYQVLVNLVETNYSACLNINNTYLATCEQIYFSRVVGGYE